MGPAKEANQSARRFRTASAPRYCSGAIRSKATTSGAQLARLPSTSLARIAPAHPSNRRRISFSSLALMAAGDDPSRVPTVTPEERLAQLGFDLPPPPPAVGAYVPWTRTGNLVLTSFQLPWRDGDLAYTGLLGEALSAAEGYG